MWTCMTMNITIKKVKWRNMKTHGMHTKIHLLLKKIKTLYDSQKLHDAETADPTANNICTGGGKMRWSNVHFVCHCLICKLYSPSTPTPHPLQEKKREEKKKRQNMIQMIEYSVVCVVLELTTFFYFFKFLMMFSFNFMQITSHQTGHGFPSAVSQNTLQLYSPLVRSCIVMVKW